MCFALYLASDTPLPVIPWDATLPSVYVEKDTYHKPIPALSKHNVSSIYDHLYNETLRKDKKKA